MSPDSPLRPGPLRIGTRSSALALWQAGWVRDALQTLGLAAELAPMTTSGDRNRSEWLAEAGGKGLFTKELDEALQEKRIDLAVHSLKDVPARLPDGLVLAATPPRADPRDGWIAAPGMTLRSLADGARVGTSSPRRWAQLQALRPGLRIIPLRGNLDTRIRKWREGEYDAIVLAMAGLNRLAPANVEALPIAPEDMLPAAGQGVLCLECRAGDLQLRAQLAALHDARTGLAVAAERRLLRRLGVGCQSPFAAYAQIETGIPGSGERPAAPDLNSPLYIRLRARLDHGAACLRADDVAALASPASLVKAAWVTPLDSRAEAMARPDEDGLPNGPGLFEAHAMADQAAQKLLAQGADSILHASHNDE